jgi:lipopolysaccharide/colanic/teichoic acid biosynthesis glycosyltransferase
MIADLCCSAARELKPRCCDLSIVSGVHVMVANSETVSRVPIAIGLINTYSAEQARAGARDGDSKMPVYSWRYRYLKRVMDLACASVLLVLFAIPGLFIAAAILFTSPGSAFYREERIGRGGTRFRIWKFRSMRQDAAEDRWLREVPHNGSRLQWRMRKDLRDPRVTTVGRFLRQWSLDELPQLFNILS